MSLIQEYLLHFSKGWISSSILLQLQRERISFHREGWALLNHETPRHRNSYFFPTFFLEHRISQRNKFSWYWFCWEIYGICKEGLQTWMSRCAIDSLDKQSGWKLSLSLVEKYIQTKVSYSQCCILSEKRRNLTRWMTRMEWSWHKDNRFCEFVKNQPDDNVALLYPAFHPVNRAKIVRKGLEASDYVVWTVLDDLIWLPRARQ